MVFSNVIVRLPRKVEEGSSLRVGRSCGGPRRRRPGGSSGTRRGEVLSPGSPQAIGWFGRRPFSSGGALGAVAVAGLTTANALARRPPRTGAELSSRVRLPPPFQVPLPLPPVLKPVATTGGIDRYEITQREVTAEVLPGVRTPLWTYEGTFPGPTIESRRGRPVSVRHRNELPVPTVVHLHGGRTPAASDGYPTDLVLPDGWPDAVQGGHGMHGMPGGVGGARSMHDPRAVPSRLTRDYAFPLDQRPTLLWYHDHRMDFTAPAIWRGLAGLHIVRDDAEEALGLPSGPRELPLMIGDRAFHADGTLAYPSLDPALRTEPGGGGALPRGRPRGRDPGERRAVARARSRCRPVPAARPERFERPALRAGSGRRGRPPIGPDPGRRRPGAARRTGPPPVAADRTGRTLRRGRRPLRHPSRRAGQGRQPAGFRADPGRDGLPRRAQGPGRQSRPPRPVDRPAHLEPVGRRAGA
ncbi:multicopper oxidase domain-containing protein [Actinomadura sp. NPDC000929]|uniref:multicopper oxidase family protein n=1 Tax=Actinomadura sp. NPDC000929 TaxID=3154517 RepID=UPI003393D4A5